MILVCITFLEIMVAVIQAYVFSLLVTIYFTRYNFFALERRMCAYGQWLWLKVEHRSEAFTTVVYKSCLRK